MSRRLTVLAVLLAAGVSFGLYRTELQVRQMQRELARLSAELVEDQRTIRVLSAEWSYLNRPERLQELSERYLLLLPPTAQQLVQPEALARLPERPQALARQEQERRRDDGAWPSLEGALPVPAWKPETLATGVSLTIHGGGGD